MSQPNLRVTSVAIGSLQPRELARFYADLLGWRDTASEGPLRAAPSRRDGAQVKPPPDVDGPTLNF